MDSVRNSVLNCCVCKGGRILYSYNHNGDAEIEKLAVLCLEKAPPYHQWYFETMSKKTFGFLMDDGCVYFAIVNESIGNSRVLRFLQKLRDEFRKIGKKGTSKNVSSLNSVCLQEQLLPVVSHLVASLEHVSETGERWPQSTYLSQGELTPSPGHSANGNFGRGGSTKAPLLGKSSKQDRKHAKDHVIAVRGVEMEEHRRSTDRGIKIDSGDPDSNSQETVASPLRKEYNSRGIKSSSQSLQKRWCRQVRIVLAIDAAVCIILLVVWLVICRGIQCTR